MTLQTQHLTAVLTFSATTHRLPTDAGPYLVTVLRDSNASFTRTFNHRAEARAFVEGLDCMTRMTSDGNSQAFLAESGDSLIDVLKMHWPIERPSNQADDESLSQQYEDIDTCIRRGWMYREDASNGWVRFGLTTRGRQIKELALGW